ncbi:transcription initiation factor IIA subunit 2 [Solea senegalensis]|uniref:Transcription initiation factor IIA subunit 2 n=1 Tax=Solea senegalensis TaxID=28829 RepID=A0AAV6Q3P3_SOLSE|nr:transcription initiation factor IIA subunit 2 [Solea senegalensis]
MAYQLYRNTTLGNSLQESLDELIQTQQITPQLALQVLLQFDKAINTALANRVRNRVNFRGSLNTYRLTKSRLSPVTERVSQSRTNLTNDSGSNVAE